MTQEDGTTMPALANKPRKQRINGPDGKLRWVPVAELTPMTEVMADLSAGEFLDWEGNEVAPLAEDYEDYINSQPSKEDLRPYPKPVGYWEVRYPGCTLQPYPRMGGFSSEPSGRWQATNRVKETAIREHIRATAKVDPDLLKISDEELATMSGRGTGAIRYCQDGCCNFVSCSMTAINLHEALCGHRTDSRPRKDTL